MKKRGSVGIGIVGMGFMGLTHLRAARTLRRGKVVALVTSDRKKAKGDFSSVKGNFGAGGARENLAGISIYPTLDDLIDDDGVDLVDICLPSYLHKDSSIRSMKAGKSALVEKPIALRPRDAVLMAKTSETSGKLLMVGQVLKFLPEFAALSDAIRSQRYGKLLALNVRRVVAAPEWGDSWFSDPKLSGGMVVDLHIHDTDFLGHLFGKVRAVTSTGISRNSQVHFIRTTYHFGKSRNRAPLITAEAGWINAPSLAFEHGYDAFLEKATIHFNSSHCPKPRLYGLRKEKQLPVPKGNPFRSELQAAVDSVRDDKVHPFLRADSAADSLNVCLAEEKSVRTGKTVITA